MDEIEKICPKCGKAFHCRAHFIAGCACSKVQLTTEQRENLLQLYSGCLCMRCLNELETAPTEQDI